MTVADGARRGLHLQVTGVVQGVGFRPFVHRLATRFQLAGWVRNTAGTVEIAVEGEAEAVARFRAALTDEAPPLARIDEVRDLPLSAPVSTPFHITPSDLPREAPQPVPADVALCPVCEAELRDPADRRFRYPFIACTNCGPRFSVIEEMPYDRERTTLRRFALCAACTAEYEAPSHRRFHAEATACPDCGPRARLLDRTGEAVASSDDAIVTAASLLRSGCIVAVRGVGGFHLAANATDARAVDRLRQRKRREAKPLAVMARSLDEARVLAELSDAEIEWLTRPERPILVARRRPDSPVVAAVSEHLDSIGVMLPYSPLHLLLCDAACVPLVMTSGNLSNQPLVSAEDEARRALGDVADLFLSHDREIANAIDDSVVRVTAGATPILLRRARGFAPIPLALPLSAPVPLLAVGAHLKNTFALAAGSSVYVSQHVGDLETLETAEHWERMLMRYEALFHVAPEVVVRDEHPDYLSTRLAERFALPQIAVQHHHAHVAAVAAEHRVTDPVIGVALDGVGYGDDGHIWGAELLLASLTDYRRVGHLRYAPLPGGDAASRAPWRVALGYMSLEPEAFPAAASSFAGVEPHAVEVASAQARRGPNAPEASSMGRLFDAAAALLGVCIASRYEGEAAMRLEAAAGRQTGVAALPFPITERDGTLILDPIPLLAALAHAHATGRERGELAAAFHDAVGLALVRAVERIAEAQSVRTVALGGGVFQNARLLHHVQTGLEARRLRTLVPRALPPNDGGISYGQAAIAAARLTVAGSTASSP